MFESENGNTSLPPDVAICHSTTRDIPLDWNRRDCENRKHRLWNVCWA